MLESILSAGGGELARGVLSFLRRYEAAPLAEASAVCRAAVEGSESVRMVTLVSRCCQGKVSMLEATLGVTGASVLSFLVQIEARPLRVVSRACCEAVAEHAWGLEPWIYETRITGSLASWRRCFPRATHANMYMRQNTSDADMVHLSGIHTLYMSNCKLVTDAGLAHLSGIHTLYMSGCELMTDAGLAHLSGIHTLDMRGCKLVTDVGLAHLSGIHTLWMSGSNLVTDAGLAHLTGIHTLLMPNCELVTDVGLAHLSGIHTLYMRGCKLVTDAGLAHLVGIHRLAADFCPLLTAAGLARLRVGGAVII